MTENKSALRRAADKMFGGIRMTWVKVILFALASAVVTAGVLVIPVFSGTSFYEIGVSFEAWILFAILIMVNCEKPMESAVKTFVFFLISQPLIYLLQVPFYEGGFQIFQYYRHWFFITLATFPAAFVGWYLKKRNWLSLLILSPMLVMLTFLGCGYAKQAIYSFPNHLISALFCFGQIVLYVFVFFDDLKKRLAGLAVPVVLIIGVLLFSDQVQTGLGWPLSDEITSLSPQATVELEDESFGSAVLTDFDDPYVQIIVRRYGETTMRIADQGKTYRYHLESKMEDGHNQVHIKFEGVEDETK